MLANRTSRWSIGAALLCIVLLAASWFLLISPRQADAADIRAQTTAANSQAAQLQVRIAELKAQFADLPKRQAELAAIKKQLPPHAEIPTLVRDLQEIASRAGVTLDSISPGVPALLGMGDANGGVVAPAAAGSVVTVPMAISVTGDYFEASLFVKRLQTKISRAYLLTGITVTSAPEEEVPVTAAPTPTPTATGTATPVPTVAPTTAPAVITNPLERVTLSMAGSVFVLMDGTTTLEDVAKDVKAGAAGANAATQTTAPTPAGASTAAAN